jgi:hypothetical protein
MGAFVTAYLMMNNDLHVRVPYRSVNPPQLTTEASVDPALNSLFEVEKRLGNMSNETSAGSNKRVPSQMGYKKNKIR